MNMIAPIILIIEDEKEIRRFVKLALENENCKVFEADNMKRGLIEAATRKPDLIILDLGLPDGDGLDFIKDIRQWSTVQLIVLSARSTEEDKVNALDAGAEDFLVKPFGVSELLARVRVALRRKFNSGQNEPLIEFGVVSIDFINRQVTYQEKAVHLTPIEFKLLTELVTNPGKVLTQRDLLNRVWGPNSIEQSHYLRIYMGHLRQKLEVDPSRPKHFITEIGVGYRFLM